MLDLLSKTGKLGVKPCSSPMVPSVHLTRKGETFEVPEIYRRLVRKLNYLLVTRPDIAHSVSMCPLQRSTIGQLLNSFYVPRTWYFIP